MRAVRHFLNECKYLEPYLFLMLGGEKAEEELDAFDRAEGVTLVSVDGKAQKIVGKDHIGGQRVKGASQHYMPEIPVILVQGVDHEAQADKPVSSHRRPLRAAGGAERYSVVKP